MQLHTYLNYGGNCEQAFRFYEQHLGGKITMLMRHGEQPDGPPGNLSGPRRPPRAHGSWRHRAPRRRHSARPLSTDPQRLSVAHARQHQEASAFALLSDGGEVFMPMQETFFATRFAMLRDRFGTSWMLLHPKPMSA